ncbi:MAG: prolyl oligopeptidase family serine peptidase [Oxalobacteraceae bacterium]|nr:prolyl oligopeptidase family serine peptidase [Oxalobacteraceae bacterium]
MNRRPYLVFVQFLFVLTILAWFTQQSHAQTLDASINEHVLMLPVTENGKKLQFETTLYKPPGQGPFPLLLMNHGKERGKPSAQKRDRFLAMGREFVRRGYAVAVPMRKGFSKSEGIYSDYGCNMHDNGMVQADDIEAALRALTKLSWVDHDRVIVAGQSYGGLATMAFGTRQFPGVRGLLNFAGGLRIDGHYCDWQSALVTAFRSYGSRTSLPSLWFYGENDSYFDPSLAQRLQTAYQSAGGSSQLIAFGRFKSDAHGLVSSRDGIPVWWPATERFLQRIGLPTDINTLIGETERLPASGFAANDNADAVPHLTETGRAAYRHYLSQSLPRAFALSASGAWSWAEDGDDPPSRALAACQKNSKLPCKLYSVDQDVVWRVTENSGALFATAQ